jgi:transcriptional regulator with XRE-family HTH domain
MLFTLGDVIEKLRDERGWTGLRLAREAGVNKATIVKLENEPLTAKQETIEKVAAAFGMTSDELRALVPDAKRQEATLETGGKITEGMVKRSHTDDVGIAIPYGSSSSLPPPVVNPEDQKGTSADAERPRTPAPPLSLEERDAIFNEQYNQLRLAYAAAGDLRISLFNIITAVGPLAVEIAERRRKTEEARRHRAKGRRRHRASGR